MKQVEILIENFIIERRTATEKRQQEINKKLNKLYIKKYNILKQNYTY